MYYVVAKTAAQRTVMKQFRRNTVSFFFSLCFSIFNSLCFANVLPDDVRGQIRTFVLNGFLSLSDDHSTCIHTWTCAVFLNNW